MLSVSTAPFRALRPLCFAAAWLAVLTIGCGKPEPPSARVVGKVVVDGKPAGGAVVTFVSPRSRDSAMAPVDGNGSFEIEHLPPNRYTVYVLPEGSREERKASPIPEKYWKEATTDLSVMLVEGKNDVTLKMAP